MERSPENNLPTNSWVPINRPSQSLPSMSISEHNESMASQGSHTDNRAQNQATYITPPQSIAGSSSPKPRRALPSETPPNYMRSISSESAEVFERPSRKRSTAVYNRGRPDSGETSIAAVEQTSEEETARQKFEALLPPKDFWQPSDTELKANGKKVERTGDLEKVEGHADAWASTLRALRFTAGDWPKEKLTIQGMAPHEGKANSIRRVAIGSKIEKLPVCELPFIIYHVLCRAPGQMLLLDQLFNITLAIVPNLNPKNASTRHCLSTHSEFKNVTEDRSGRTIAGWTIATAAEFEEAERLKREKKVESNAKNLSKGAPPKRRKIVEGESGGEGKATSSKMARTEAIERLSNQRSLPENVDEAATKIRPPRWPKIGGSPLRNEIRHEDIPKETLPSQRRFQSLELRPELFPRDLVELLNIDETSLNLRDNESNKAAPHPTATRVEEEVQGILASSSANEHNPSKRDMLEIKQFSLGPDSLSHDTTTWTDAEREAALAYIQDMFDRKEIELLCYPQFHAGWDRLRHAMAFALYVHIRYLNLERIRFPSASVHEIRKLLRGESLCG